MAPTTLPVMEIYPAIQGEGTKSGEASVFIRLFGCNLRCTWCDTAYSINMAEARAMLDDKAMSTLYTKYTPKDLAKKIESEYPFIPNIVITGGEPTLHLQLLLAFSQFVDRKRITVESNGTIIPAAEGLSLIDLWSISPKVPGSQATSDLEIQREVGWKVWAERSRLGHTQFKFVITDLEKDLGYLLRVFQKYPDLTLSPIILVPNGDLCTNDGEEVYWAFWASISTALNNEEWLPFSWNIRVLPQLHLLAFGRKRFT